MSLPSSIIAVLAHFEPLFTAPTWKKAGTLLVGTVLARGHRTVTTALRQMGHQMNPQFSVFHHVLNRARWSPLEVSRRLLQQGVTVREKNSASELQHHTDSRPGVRMIALASCGKMDAKLCDVVLDQYWRCPRDQK
jgi:hypothetical protein